MRLLIAAGSALALAACNDGGARGAGEVSPPEAKALEDAASMLDERRLPPAALPPEGQPTPETAPQPAPEPARPEMTGDTALPARQ